MAQRELSSALTYLTRGLAIRDKTLAETDPELADCHLQFGQLLYTQLHQAVPAEPHLRRAAAIYTHLTSGEAADDSTAAAHREAAARCMNCLARLLLHLGGTVKLADAGACGVRASELLHLNAAAADHPDVVDALHLQVGWGWEAVCGLGGVGAWGRYETSAEASASPRSQSQKVSIEAECIT